MQVASKHAKWMQMVSTTQLGNGPASSGNPPSPLYGTFSASIMIHLANSCVPSHSIGMMKSESTIVILCTDFMTFFSVRDSLHCGTQDITAADHPTFLWPKGVFHIDDIYKGFLHGELLVMVCPFFVSSSHYADVSQAYKHIFISPSSAKETNKSMHGGNAELHNITFVTYQSVAYVATVVSKDCHLLVVVLLTSNT